MTDGHDAKIQELEAKVEAERPGLEAECVAFVEAAARCLEDFWPNFVTLCIKHARDEIAEMDREAIGVLKAEVDAVVARPREVAEEELVEKNRKAWPHLSPLDDLVDDFKNRPGTQFSWVGMVASPVGQMPEAMTKPMSYAAAAPAARLQASGLPVPSRQWDQPTADIDWIEAMEAALKGYGVAARTMFETCGEIARARTERDKDRALDLWNEA